MSGHDTPEAIQQETRRYLLVFGALAVLTVLTVAVSYIDTNHTSAVVIALLIATVKGSLVAAFFMHLISERKFIYGVLALTFIFFIALFVLPMGSFADGTGDHYVINGVEHPTAGESH